ncbi:RidA family protein [Serpentinicella sp. ANB-PHB4]|uniref:RidA family protein n=1 Tax=Serpentinicella sp. ANB-PHB4 TaxID=3074076 RepID=UPI0028629784|nr:RidA family protein [Serpentinicella sp. ANB-PHB4]MDR5658048.1 RidA family protein [Serpentinicella sp. ANB-PHB4]
MKQEITSKNAPTAIGPYSQGIKVNNILFVSGQIPLDPQTMQIISEDIVQQTKQVLNNVEAVLSEAGSSLSNVVKTTIFIKNMDDFDLINDVYSMYFKENKPARSCVEVSRLPKDVKVKIEVIAIV